MNDEGGPSVLYLEACFGATMAATPPPPAAAAAMLINSKATFPAALLSSQLDSLQRYKAPPVNERTDADADDDGGGQSRASELPFVRSLGRG